MLASWKNIHGFLNSAVQIIGRNLDQSCWQKKSEVQNVHGIFTDWKIYMEIWKPRYFCNQSDTYGFYMVFHQNPTCKNYDSTVVFKNHGMESRVIFENRTLLSVSMVKTGHRNPCWFWKPDIVFRQGVKTGHNRPCSFWKPDITSRKTGDNWEYNSNL